MRSSIPKFINPLRLSILISGMTFLFFIVGMSCILLLSRNENKIIVQALSQSAIRAHFDKILAGEYREFVEALSMEIPALHISIMVDKSEAFRFNTYKKFSTCKNTKIKPSSDDNESIFIKVCKPLIVDLSVVIPLVVSFLILVAGIAFLALGVEKKSRHSLMLFLKEAGFILKENLSFGESLAQLQSLKKEFIALKKKVSLAAEKNTKDKIAAHLAHDLRSPLLVFQELLSVQSEKEFLEAKPRLFESISRVHYMINSLNDRDLKSIERMHFQHFSLDALLHEVKIHAKKRKIKFITQLEQKGAYFLDKHKVERALANLLHNAIRFCESTVIFRMQSKCERLIFTISDDGKGVPEEFSELIYEEHFSFGNPQGTGLGLSYARNIVSAHNGSLRHFKQNGFTVFEMVIPLKDFPEENQLAPVLPMKRVFVLLENKRLKEELQKAAPQWEFASEFPTKDSLQHFYLVYSDLPELVTFASQNVRKVIVASETDNCEKIVKKIKWVLGTL